MTSNPISVRLSEEEVEVMDALADVRTAATGVRHSRADVLRWLLRKAEPSDDTGPHFLRHRIAYANAYIKKETP